jgi:23S rRNA (cytosine1962-C5)-methyltransferase
MPSTLKLKPNATARVRQGHPWVFGNECEQLLPAENDGTVVECRDPKGRFLGTGIYNSKSQIVWRRLSRERVELNEAYLRGAIARSIQRRDSSENIPGGAALQRYRRLVWSESDELPGVVADQFGDAVVVQIQTLAMEKHSALVGDLLAELAGAQEVIFRNDSNLRRLEGLAMDVHTRSGRSWEPRWANIDGFDYWLDLQGGQKTGFYLDQRLQHVAVARYAPGRRVLDAFCNQGSFALHCSRAGAVLVLGLDSSEEAVAQAKKNAAHNAVKADFEVANVFDWFTARREAAPTWDLIVLDPPPFAKSKSALANALRGYKELNLRAMQALAPGGVLATYTCSHHMHDAELRQVLAESASDAKRRVHVLEWCHQPPDHPVLATMPESEYLRGYIVRVD